MSSGLYSGVSGLALGVGLYKGVSGLWGGASGLITGFGSSFSPTSLFAAGEGGYWLDPSDYTTMWQDSQGTTPVTATGQSNGLILDKRIGTRTQVFNDANVTLGGPAGNAARVSPGVYNYARDATGIGSVVFGGLTTGRTYLVSVQIAAYGGSVPGITTTRADYFSALNFAIRNFTGAGTQTFFYLADGPTFSIRSGGGNGTGGTITNVSILDVPGNHFLQATAASRPIGGIEPVGGRRNVLTFTEQFDNAAWVKGNLTVFSNTAVAPDGTMTADTLVENTATATHTVGQNGGIATNVETISFYAKPAGRNWVAVQVGSAGTAYFDVANGVVGIVTSGTADISPAGNGWYRCTFTCTRASFTVNVIYVASANNVNNYTGDGTSGILLWGAQLENGSTATTYQRVTDQWNVTQAGVPSVYYLAFDGTDDGLVSAATINPGAVDKAQVFAGVRKLSDAGFSPVILEVSASPGINAGVLGLNSNTGSGAPADYAGLSRGTTGLVLDTANVFAAPITNVLTLLGDISGDSAILRVNGVQAASNTADQGTGNYLTHTHFIGRRNNASLPYNGRVYQMIMRYGPNLTAATITQTETFTNSKTGAY